MKHIKIETPPQNIKIAVDNCIFTILENKLNLLLIKMKKKPYTGQWALPGGLIFNMETLDDAALRILSEQTGIKNVYLEQLYTFSKINRDPLGRVISSVYYSLIPSPLNDPILAEKYDDVKWFKIKDIPNPLAYDHNEISSYALKRLQDKLEYTNIVWSLLPEKFTLSELQSVYEAVLDKKIDKRNFRKKILSLNLINETGDKKMKGAHRPAMLYNFNSNNFQIVNIL